MCLLYELKWAVREQPLVEASTTGANKKSYIDAYYSVTYVNTCSVLHIRTYIPTDMLNRELSTYVHTFVYMYIRMYVLVRVRKFTGRHLVVSVSLLCCTPVYAGNRELNSVGEGCNGGLHQPLAQAGDIWLCLLHNHCKLGLFVCT